MTGADMQSESAVAPRTSRALAIVAVLGGMALTGALLGVLWAWIAPPINGVVALTRAGNRVHAYLGYQAEHFFVAAAMLLGLLAVLAVVAPVLAWQWRAHRGPTMVAALAAGAVAAAGLAAVCGATLVHGRYAGVDVDAAPVTPENRVYYFTEAPAVFFGHSPWQIVATLLQPAALAALVYALLAAATPRDDLGGYPTVDQAGSAPSATATAGGAPLAGR